MNPEVEVGEKSASSISRGATALDSLTSLFRAVPAIIPVLRGASIAAHARAGVGLAPQIALISHKCGIAELPSGGGGHWSVPPHRPRLSVRAAGAGRPEGRRKCGTLAAGWRQAGGRLGSCAGSESPAAATLAGGNSTGGTGNTGNTGNTGQMPAPRLLRRVSVGPLKFARSSASTNPPIHHGHALV